MATQIQHPRPAHADRHGHHPHDGHGEIYADHLRFYYITFAALMVLLVLTLVAAAFHLGALNLPIALAIAVAKAVLVMIFFMHLKWNSMLVRVCAAAAFIWLIVLFVLSLADYVSRPPDALPIASPHKASRPIVTVIPYS